MVEIVGLAGSLRRGSFNRFLLRAACELAPDGTRIEAASIGEIPLYDGDLEAEQGLPPAVAALKERIAGAAGLLLVTPEYNNSLPGAFKNAIDWLSRPPQDLPRVFGGLPVGVIGATPGAGGTALAQVAWLPVLRTLGTSPWFGGRLQVSAAHRLFAADGSLTDEETRARLRRYLDGFAAFVAARGSRSGA